MAGVKGKSGGPRQNAGGARPGAGRKPKATADKSANQPKGKARGAVSIFLEPQPGGGALKRSTAEPVALPKMDMLEMLQAVALGHVEATATQVRAAVAAVQYTHTKKGDGGKKEEKQAAAGAAAKGRFGAAPAPLRAVK